MSGRVLVQPRVGSRWYSLALMAATLLMVVIVVAGAVGTADAASRSELRKFESKVFGKFNAAALATGVTRPSDAGFGDTIIVAHKCDVPLLSVGSMASTGVQALAETGSTAAFEAELDTAVAAGDAQEFWTINPPNGPNKGKGGPNLTIEEEFSCVTILVKINPSSDWFAGISAYDLHQGGTWPTLDADNKIFIELFPFDAGTLDGTEFESSTTATSPQGTIASLRNTGKFSDNKIAELVLTMKNPAITRDVTAEEGVESITARWGEVAAAGGYHVMWKSGAEVHDTDGSAGRRDVVVGGKTRTHTITGLTGGVEYNVQVMAYNGAGQSSQEPTSESHAYATPISAPTANNTVLVGNATQLVPGTERLTIGVSQYRARAQAFTTGSEPAVLGSVTLPSFKKESNNAQMDVHIYSASGVDPGVRLHTLTRPDFSSLGTGVVAITFDAPAGETITLAANTTYFVYADSVQGGVGLLHTKDDDEDPSSDEGWSIADRCRVIYRTALPNEACSSTQGGALTAALVMVLNSPLEDDKPLLSITGSQAVEGSGVQFTVSLSAALGEEVTVEYSTADDSATTADSDYTGVSAATLTFAANETEKTVTITTTADSVDEDDETFNVELSSPSENAQLGFVTAASGLILNNDQTTQTDGTLSSITLTGSDGSTIALTPTFDTYSFLYTATADSEIDSLTGVVTPSTSGTVDSILYVGGNEDTNTAAYDAVWPLVPGDNLVKFMVTSPDGSRTKIYKIHVDKAASTDATLGALAFVDNNGAITLSPAFNSATTSYTATVGAAATSVTLTGMTSFSGATMSNTHGPDTMSGVATEAAWTGASEIGITVTAEDGTTTQYYSVVATRNLEVSFGSATYSVDEGDMVEVSVELNGDPGQQVSVDLLATGSGATAADSEGVPGNVIFAAGERARTFQFRARTDAVTDDGETVTISMSMLTAGLVKGSPDETVITIDDVGSTQLVAVNFGQSTYSVAEGSTVSITVTLAAAPSTSIVIPLTVTGEDGATTADYDVPTSVTFDTGDTSEMIAFSATLDSPSDAGESVKIELGTLPPGYGVGTTFETAVSIADVAATVNFGAADYEVAENANLTVTVTVTLSPALGSPVIIPLTATGKGGAAPADYSLSATSVTFDAGDTAKTVIFTPKNDDVDDDGESVLIEFGTLPAGVGAGTTYATTTVSIKDNDHPDIDVGFKEGGYSVSEGAFIDLIMELTAPPEREIAITLQSTAASTASIDDYTVAPVLVEFAATATTATVKFTAADDSFNDDGEFVKLEPDLALPGNVGLGVHFFTIVTIVDTDVPAVTVSFEHATYIVDEGESVDVKVKLSADPERTVVIPISRSEANIGSGDYSGVPMSVSFANGETEKIISFVATEDTENDDGESLLLGFGPLPLPADVSLGTYSQSTVSITDDDVPAVTVSFAEASYTVAESDDPGTPVKENEVAVKVKLSADPERTVSIVITRQEQGAVSGDYSGVPMTVSFASGETEKTITFTATHDTDNDDGESVTLGFGSLSPGVTEGATNEAMVSIADDDFPAVTVSFEHSTYTVAESDDPDTLDVEEHKITVKVSLSADPERTVVIPVGELRQGGVSAVDYTGVPGNVTFESGDTEMSFTFTALHDTVDDDGEQLRLTLGPLPVGVTGAAPYSAVFSITDDDDPQVEVTISSSVTTVAEGGTATVTVSLDKDPEREVIVPITKTNLGGASAMDANTIGDYSGVPDELTFADGGPTTQSFTFVAVDDTVDDDDEGVTIGLGTLEDDGVSAGTSDEITISIDDNDVPEVTVSFEKSSYTVAESDDTTTSGVEEHKVTVKVKLSADPERNLTIPLSPEGLGDISSADYSGIPANISFSTDDTNKTEKTFTFTATHDDADDDGEGVKITFDTNNLPDRVSAGVTDETTISITDDDFPSITVNFEKDSYTVAESDDLTTSGVEEHKVAVKVKLNAVPERQVTIPFTITSDTAGSTDYSTSSSVIFEANDIEKTFTFTAEHDSTDDDDESVKIAFSSSLPTGITAGDTAETVVGITDDDVPDVTVKFDPSTYDAPEGGDITVTVLLSPAPERSVTIPLTATPNGATAADYTAVAQSVTFGATDTSQSITFTAANDNISDDGESVTIGFDVSLPPGVTAGTPSEATVTIIDNIVDVVADFESAMYTAAEGATVTITVTLDKDPERMVSILLTSSGQDGATEEDDYSDFPASVSFASGEMSKTFTFTVDSDDVDDDDESVVIGFGTLPTGVTAGTIDETTVNITDDDDPMVMVSFEKDSYTVPESDDPDTLDVEEHKVTVTVLLSADPERTVEVPLMASGQDGATDPTGPTDPADYRIPDSVTFGPGERSKMFELTAEHDDVDDDDESVKIEFGTITDLRVSKASPVETTVAITDDDSPFVKVSFSHAMHTVAEGAEVDLTVSLDVDPERELIIELVPKFDGGATDADYTGVPTSVTLSTDKRSETITFMAVQDSEDDDEDQVTIGFGTMPDERVSAGEEPSTQISITDDDDPQVTVRFGAATYTVPEDGSASVTVLLSVAPERTVTIPLTETPLNDISDGDYDGVPTKVEFAVDQTEAMFTVTASSDEEDDDDESVEIRFGELPAGVTAVPDPLGNPPKTTVAIVDGNVPDVMVKIEASSETVTEGESVVVTVTLDRAPERAVTVPLTITPVGTYSADDVDEPLPTSVEFLEDQITPESFTINAKDDDIDDDDEGFTIGLGTLPSKVSAGSPSEATIGITDNDDPDVTVSFEQAEYTVPEGTSQAIQVNLSADPERDLTVTLEFTTEADGATADDYSMDPAANPLTLTFEPGGTEQSFTFTSTQDTDDDDGEIVTVTFNGSLPARVTEGSPDEAVVTIKPHPATVTVVGGGGGGGSNGPTPSLLDLEWNVTRDIESLDPGNDGPTGMWSYGNTLYIADNGDGADDGVYAYDLATGERTEEHEFALDATNRAPRGFWSDGETVWVSDSGRERLFAYGLGTGERAEEHEFELADRNEDARGIWSDGARMWVLDGHRGALFAYDLATGALLGEYELASANGNPYGVWSDGTSIWVSDHDRKHIFAYELPSPPDEPVADDAAPASIERVTDEEFTALPSAGNNSPRGISSDGDVLYVADASNGRVYTYNMPAVIDARLASLALEGIDIAFGHDTLEYHGIPVGGATQTTVTARAARAGATIAVTPADADADASGHQVSLDGASEITVTVTSPDGSRTRVYRVHLGEAAVQEPPASCLRGAVAVGFSLIVHEGGVGDALEACAQSRNITALYTADGGEFVSYILGAPEFVNDRFSALYTDGVPALTPLIAKSDGPATGTPIASGVTGPWAACLQGEIVEGFNLVLYEGGSVGDLEACAEGMGLAALYVLDDGVWVSYIAGAPGFVNRSFRELFADGVPAATPLAAKRD